MRLLQRNSAGQISLTEDLNDDSTPKYAILSHTWGPDAEEVTFEDMINGAGGDKLGYEKIRFCGEQAREDGLLYFWIDTCCINQRNDAEVSRSINSMFRWYQKAAKCYVYLSDVPTKKRKASDQFSEYTWESDFRNSRWFTRGWTLQELLAPASVEFFSWKRKRLGNKSSLRQLICEITNIPHSALQGDPISQFSVDERFRWVEHRRTKQEEDKAYSLLGIFNVYILPIYGEGIGNAFKRLREEIDRLQRCIQDLCLTNPRDNKDGIEQDKGGLLRDSYQWILQNADFQQWRNDQQRRLLWIKGDPGKGKTMLLCGIINELVKFTVVTANVSFFFCQATHNHINTATAVLRGLIGMLMSQQPSLISHVCDSYGGFEKERFEGPNAWVALKKAFTNILEDPHLQNTYLIVDALDECTADLSLLLDLVVHTSTTYSCVKWIVSSRNWPIIEKNLKKATQKVRLSLELNEESISEAVKAYIQFKIDMLAERNDYDNCTRDAVQRYLSSNANGTFLWVALVCKELVDVSCWEAEAMLTSFPPGLDTLYKRMLDQIHPRTAKLCKSILAVVSAVYRPITLDELATFVDMPPRSFGDYKIWEEIVGRCGSFLTLRDRTIYVVHQSAKDFLLKVASHEIFPSGIEIIHHIIFSRWLQVISKTLRRDIYNLRAPGYAIERVKQPDPDPLAASRYSCIYWIDHLCAWDSKSRTKNRVDLKNGGAVEMFIREKYLYWLEALSLCRSISDGVVSMAKLEALLRGREGSFILLDHVRDARRFIMQFKWAIEKSPLQAYTSALVFSPTCSLIRRLFKEEEPKWITTQSAVEDNWNACLQTLEGHSSYVSSVAFSHDSTRLASASGDKTVKIWDASNGACLQTLEGHSSSVTSVAFSHDSTRLASGSNDKTVKIWNTSNSACLQTLEGHSRFVSSVAFSHDSSRLASGSWDKTVKIWNTSNSACLRTLESHSSTVYSVVFSHDSTRLASASDDRTVKIWDASNGACLRTLEGHSSNVYSVAFSHDSTWILSGDKTVKIWDASNGVCLRTLEVHGNFVSSVAFSHDSSRLASGSWDNRVETWDVSNGACLQMLEGHGGHVGSVAFSHDSSRLASGSGDNTVKIWDASNGVCLRMPGGHSSYVSSVAFSHDSSRFASGSDDNTVKIWDTSNGVCLQTLEGHSSSVSSVVFSHDSSRLASGSWDNTVKIWDANNSACLQTLEGHSGIVWSVAFSHDSSRLASASGDKTVKIWDVSNSVCLRTLESHGNLVSSVAFSHDSSQLASGSGDNTVKIWNANNGACLRTLEGHSSSVSSVAFSHDSSWLASGSWDNTVKIWDASNGACMQTLEIGKPIQNISFDLTGSYLYTSIGAIALGASLSSLSASSNLTSVVDPRSPQYCGWALGSDGEWITYNSENWVWIPSEYRPSYSTLSGKTIGISTGSGKVWMCSFKVDNI